MYRQNEAQGRYVAEQLNWYVSWWSLTQAVIILMTGVGQLFVLKRFFTETRDRMPSIFNNHCTDKMAARP